MPFHTQVKIRFADVDAAGLAFYPRIFEMLHLAFERLFEERFGISYADVIQKDHLGFPTVHLECDFKGPLRFGEVGQVEIAVERLGEKSISLRYRVGRAGALCVDAKATVVSVRVEDNSPIPIPEKYRRWFAEV